MEQQIQALLTPHGALPAKALLTRNVVKPALASGPPPFGSQSAAAAPSVGGQSAVTLSSTPAAANQGIPVVEVVDDQPAESPAPEAPDESWIDELLVDFVHACQEDYDALVNDLWACAKIMKDKATKEYDSLQRNIRESAADAAILVRDENGGITGISESIAPTNTKMPEHLSTRYKRDLTWLHMEYACNQFARDDTGLHADAYIDSKMPVEIQKFERMMKAFVRPHNPVLLERLEITAERLYTIWVSILETRQSYLPPSQVRIPKAWAQDAMLLAYERVLMKDKPCPHDTAACKAKTKTFLPFANRMLLTYNNVVFDNHHPAWPPSLQAAKGATQLPRKTVTREAPSQAPKGDSLPAKKKKKEMVQTTFCPEFMAKLGIRVPKGPKPE